MRIRPTPATHNTSEQIMSLIEAPFQRILHAPFWGKLFAAFTGALQFFFSHLFGGILILVIAASILDWYYGRALAKRDGVYDRDIARFGLVNKIAGVAFVLMVYGFEFWMSSNTGFSTGGFGAAALGAALFASELESFHDARLKGGMRRIPLASSFIEWARKVIPSPFERKPPKSPPTPPLDHPDRNEEE